jgi:small conductance mechanosensitive channel
METSELVGTLIDKLERWVVDFVRLLPNLVLAIILLVAFFFFARLLERLSKKYLGKARLNQTISGFLSRLFFLTVVIVGLMFALSILNLSGTVASILAGLGIMGLALGFAFQDTAANFMSGIFITFQQPFRIGDIIETHNGVMGNVVDIDLRVTKVKTFDGPVVFVPNRFLFQEEFTNYTVLGKRRVRIDCGVSYGDDLEKVERIAKEAMVNIPGRVESEEITLFWKGFGDSSIDFSVNIWLEYNREHRAYIAVKNHAVKNLKKAFDENDIMIPFPIRTLDFGIKGGTMFHEEMAKTNSSKNNSGKMS